MVITNWTYDSEKGVRGLFESGVCVKECPHESNTLAIECMKEDDTCPDAAQVYLDYGSYEVMEICLPTLEDTKRHEEIRTLIKEVEKEIANEGIADSFSDVYNSSRSIYLSIGLSVLYSLAFIIFLSIFGEFLGWVLVLLIELFFILAAKYYWNMWSLSIKEYDDTENS